MDRIRTLLLARTNVVVMDPDLVASAATRPTRDQDVEKLEDELAQLGYVMSLDLATMVRRLPYQTMQEMRGWIYDTLAKQVGAHRPHVPLYRSFPADVPANPQAQYLKRMLTWLLTKPEQPCPWCAETKRVGALDPCGHLVCRSCWDGASFTGCPICHRRIAIGDPFVKPPEQGERVAKHSGSLTLLDLGFDLVGIARQRFSRLLARVTPLSPADREEVEVVIDTIGPRAVVWLPERIPLKETMAIAIARLVMISPNRTTMMHDLQAHVRTATDVLRIAAVLMGTNPELIEPMRFGSLDRGLRRALLEAIERLPLEDVVDEFMRRRRLWKRVGERLHPFEQAAQLPNTALAFAVIRATDLTKVSFGAALRDHAVRQSFAYIDDNRIKAVAWAAPIEEALRASNPRSALARLTHRPGELLRRADHLVRVAQTRQVDALQTILKAIDLAAARGPAGTMLTLASHIARRGRPWPRRVFFPKGEVLRAWGTADTRGPLRGDAIAMIVGSLRRHLVARAEARRQFPRAVIDRSLVDLLIPISERTTSRAKVAWPRGSEVAVPMGTTLRLFLHWEEPASTRVDLDLSVVLFDQSWRHVGTCDYTNLVVGGGAAVHSGDLTSAPAPLGASEFVDLHLERLAMLGARHLVMAVFSYNDVPFESLSHGFAGLMHAPEEGQYFDPRAVMQRFDLRGRSVITVPLTIDLAERRLRWLDVHVRGRAALHDVGGYRAALAHIGRDFADALGTQARPTLWDLACIHAAARGNVIYVRERDGSFRMYRRRDNESKVTRLSRLMSGSQDDGRPPSVPTADAPTWFALTTAMPLPKGSVGYALDARGLGPNVEQLSAADLIAELAPRTDRDLSPR
jgi:hypothetical protein